MTPRDENLCPTGIWATSFHQDQASEGIIVSTGQKKKEMSVFFLFEFFTEYLKSTHRTMLKEEREYKKKKIHKAKNGMERAVGKGE